MGELIHYTSEHRTVSRLIPDNRLGARIARLLCSRGLHTIFCRGRPDHVPCWGLIGEPVKCKHCDL